MLYPTILLASLPTAATCFPTSAIPAPKTVRDLTNTCRATTLIKSVPTSDAFPWAEDCRAMVTGLDPASTVTLQSTPRNRWFTFWGSCAFALSIQGDDASIPPEYTIGNEYVIDLVNAAVAGLGSMQRVGAEGSMKCQAGTQGGEVDLKWSLQKVDL